MKRSKQKRRGLVWLKVVLIVIVLIAAVFGIGLLSDGFGGAVPLYGIAYGEKTYYKPAKAVSLGSIESGSTFTVTRPFGGEIATKITLKNGLDGGLVIGGEPHTLKELGGKDFSKAFTVKETESGFTLSFGSLSDIFETVLGAKTEIDDKISGELFELQVTCKSSASTFSFTVDENAPVEGVTVDPDHYVFGADK